MSGRSPLPRLVLVTHAQFGSLTDAVAWCQHLRQDYEISVVCWDYGEPHLGMEGVEVLYVSRAGSKPRRLWRLLSTAARAVRSREAAVSLVVYFPLCAIVPVLARTKPVILDIRTGYVRAGGFLRVAHNTLLSIESRFFDHVSVISDSLRKALCLREARTTLLPLGADDLPLEPKSFDRFSLLYVGTLRHRSIETTVEGFDRFCRAVDKNTGITYDLIGGGSEEDEQRLVAAIARSPYRDRITYHGPKPRSEVTPFFQRCNIGIAYIPLVKHFDAQPATKVFEYLLAGLAVAATGTRENKNVISPVNGAVFDDTADGVALGLTELYNRRGSLDSTAIRRSADGFTWPRIVERHLRPMLTDVRARMQEASRTMPRSRGSAFPP